MSECLELDVVDAISAQRLKQVLTGWEVKTLVLEIAHMDRGKGEWLQKLYAYSPERYVKARIYSPWLVTIITNAGYYVIRDAELEKIYAHLDIKVIPETHSIVIEYEER